MLAVGRFLPRVLLDALAVAATGMVVAGAVALMSAAAGGRLVVWNGGWNPRDGLSVGIAFVVDPYSAGLALIAAVLTLAGLAYTWRYFDSAEAHLHALSLLFLAGVCGFVFSGDVFDMFVFFELMGAVAYALTGFRIEDDTTVQAGLNFGIVNSFGAYLSLAGVVLLYARYYGALGLPQLSSALGGMSPTALGTAAFVLICIGLLTKAAVVPFHFWTADAEAAAPTPVCVMFSGVMVALGVYGVLRLYWTVFAGPIPLADFRRAMLVLGVLTALLGAAMCLMQRHLKRLLAYSTIAHVGLFLAAAGSGTTDGTAGAALYVAGHAGVKGALFLLVGVLLNRYGTVDELELYGRARELRVVGVLVGLAGLALAGLPPFGTALGKLVGEDALGPAGIVLFVAVSAATGGAVLRAAGRVFFGLGPQPERTPDPEETSGSEQPREGGLPLAEVRWSLVVPVALLLAGALAVGVVPGTARAFAAGAHRLLDGAGYREQALAGLPPAPLPASHLGWTRSGLALDLLAVLLALTVAAVGLQSTRIRQRMGGFSRLARPVLEGLRVVHSGEIGDYVAWLFFGAAVLGLLIGFPQVHHALG